MATPQDNKGDQGERGEKGDHGQGNPGKQGKQGAKGAPGPRGPQGASGMNHEVLTALAGLGEQVEHLDENVKSERDARKAEKETRDNQVKWFKRLLVVGAAFTLIALSAGIGSLITSSKLKTETHNRELVQQASLAGVCGITNINRIGNLNMLADIKQLKPYVPTDKLDEFVTKWTEYWQPIECRALVTHDVGVRLCLQYPDKIDPNTGKPVPTTIDKINEKNCPKLKGESSGK